MTTNETPIPTYTDIHRSLRGLQNVEPENTLLPDSFDTHLARLAEIYKAVKPLVTMLAGVPLLPPLFRKGIAYLGTAIEAVIAGAGTVSARFKAGRDL
jgi:hypothetical protein